MIEPRAQNFRQVGTKSFLQKQSITIAEDLQKQSKAYLQLEAYAIVVQVEIPCLWHKKKLGFKSHITLCGA